MSIREDVEKLEEKASNLEKSFALEMLQDYKKQNKRLFIIIIVMMLLWFATGSYLVYVLNDIQVVEEQSSVDMEAEGNNNYIGGDNNGTYESN